MTGQLIHVGKRVADTAHISIDQEAKSKSGTGNHI